MICNSNNQKNLLKPETFFWNLEGAWYIYLDLDKKFIDETAL